MTLAKEPPGMTMQPNNAATFSVDPYDIKSTDELLRCMSPDMAVAAARLAVQRFTEVEFKVQVDDLDSIAAMIARMPPRVAEKFANRAVWRAIT
ncbi:hypothetical protein [Dyella caseinilytica]|nr:hypothetical protein [Dyella caseinilytica]